MEEGNFLGNIIINYYLKIKFGVLMNYEIDNFSYLVLSILSEGYNYYGRILEGRLVLDIDLIL